MFRTLDDLKTAQKVTGLTGQRIHLKEWERIAQFQVTDKTITVAIETYEVNVLVREDRYQRKGVRILMWKITESGVVLDYDGTSWLDDFEPFVYEKIGRRKTADEFTAQREFEKMCHRPGTPSHPLDSYSRVLEGFSNPRMERHF